MTCLVRSAALAALVLGVVPTAGRADFQAVATLLGSNQAPPITTPATGKAVVIHDAAANSLDVTIMFMDLLRPARSAAIQYGTTAGHGPDIFPLIAFPTATSGSYHTILTASNFIAAPTVGINTFADAVAAIEAGKFMYVNITSTSSTFTAGGEIRGLLGTDGVVPEPSSLLIVGLGGIVLALLGTLRRPCS